MLHSLKLISRQQLHQWRICFQQPPNWNKQLHKILSQQVCNSCCNTFLLGRTRPERLLASDKQCAQELLLHLYSFGVAVQMHHLLRSRFLIDSLSTMGFASSYPELQRFEMHAACSLAPDVLGGDIDILSQSLLFAGDNVDHNIITLDGKGTFHGMGKIAALTPGKEVSHGIPRKKRPTWNLSKWRRSTL